MRAMVYRSYKGSLELVDLPKPVPQAGQLLIKSHCSSINPIDWKMADGQLRMFKSLKFPVVPGFDIAGEVAAVGEGVQGWSVGQRVHARIAEGSGAACAEFAVAAVAQSVPMPDAMTFAEAAALPLAGMTALQALRDEARMPMVGASQRVLVVGASGGVGHVAVQVAKAAGARVTGVCSGRNVALVQSLGADQVIDYTQGNAWEGQGPWDIICDCVGGAPSAWLKYLQPQGFYVSCLPGPAVIGRMLFNVFSGQKVYPVLLKPNAPDLKVLDDLYVEGKLKILVDSHYPLAELNKAWERSRSGRAVGKIVVDVGA